MKTFLLLSFLLFNFAMGVSIERAIVIYNTESPESKSVASHYIKERKIPVENLIGLKLSLEDSITMTQFKKELKTPLRKKIEERKLWEKDTSGNVISSKFDVIVTTFGMPYKISATSVPAGTDAEGNPTPEKKRTHLETDASSVDSELTLLHMGQYPHEKPLNNPFFKKEYKPLKRGQLSFFLVGRIDAPSSQDCIRMIDDAIQIEKRGLKGMCYIDKAIKEGGYIMGDQWLDSIIKDNKEKGIMTVVEETKDVFVTNYPMTDAALYYGWYSHQFSGPFLNPKFTLPKGSVAVHIHSFSASDLRSPRKRWCGPILASGAAATLGNVHEPLLHLTAHLDHFHHQLLAGKTLIESAWTATPSISWQNVVLGDPFYRPFANSLPSSKKIYNVLSDLAPISTKTKFNTLINIAEKAQSAELFEAVGLIYTTLNAHEKSPVYFRKAQELAKDDETLIRNIQHQISYYRKYDQKEKALTVLKANLLDYKEKTVGISLLAMKHILDPPAPPPVQAK